MSCSVIKNKHSEFEQDPVFFRFVCFISLLANNSTFQTVKLILELKIIVCSSSICKQYQNRSEDEFSKAWKAALTLEFAVCFKK